MTSTDFNEMIEGDLIYTDQLELLHEENILTSDYESINQDDSNHLDSILLDNTTDDDEIKIISCKIKTVQEDSSDDDVQIIAINFPRKPEQLISVERSPLSSIHINESRNSFKCNPNRSDGPVSPPHISDNNPSSLSYTNESQNLFKCDPNDSDGAVSTFYSLDRNRLSLNHNNESQSSSKGDPDDGLRNISMVYQKSLPKEIKKRFDSKNLIDLYCVNCNKINKIFRRSKRSKCSSCKTPFKYQCTQCKNRYKTFQTAFLHVKFQCELAKSYLASFHCCACYYDTRNQANLENHVLNHHAVKKCIACNEELENSQMTKHRIFECEAAEPGEIETSSENVKNKRGRKPKYASTSAFLIKYCKSCDAAKDITAGGDYSTCRDCNAVFQHECVTCCKRFQKLLTAKVHVRSCHYPPQFQCSICNYHTAYKANLIAHLDCKHKQKECEVCLTACDSNLSLRRHEKYDCKHHPRFQGGTLSTRPKMRKITNTFNILKLYCFRCKEGYERTSSILSNCKKCNNKVQLQCVKCLVLFKHFSTGYKHVKRGCRIKEKKVNVNKGVKKKKVSPKNAYKYKKCPECHRNNLEPESFDAHLKQCKSLPSFQCSSCTFCTKRKQNLRKHYKNIHLHGQKYFSCSFCQNKFRYSSLRKHQYQCRITNNI